MYNFFVIGCNGGWIVIVKIGVDGIEIFGSKWDFVDCFVVGDEIRILLNDNKYLILI